MDDVPIGEPQSRHPIELTPLRDDSSEAPEVISRSSRPLVLLVSVAALAVVVGFVLSIGRGGDTDPAATTVPRDDLAEPDDPLVVRAEEAATLLEVIPEAADHLMVFRSADSLAIVDFRDGTSRLMDWDGLDQIETLGFTFLASERGSWVIDPDNLEVALRLAPQAQIGILEDPTRTAVLAEAAGATTVLGGFFDGRAIRILATVPAGADAEVVQERGVVITPLSGGSYLVQASFPDKVSDGRIVGANADWYGEVLCDELLRCTGSVRSWDTDEAIDVPIGVLSAPEVRISPDGRWVLSGGGASSWSMYSIEDDSFAAFGAGVGPNASATWSPDSSFFLWIGEGTLYAARPERPFELVDLTLSARPLPNLVASEIAFVAVNDTE